MVARNGTVLFPLVSCSCDIAFNFRLFEVIEYLHEKKKNVEENFVVSIYQFEMSKGDVPPADNNAVKEH